MSENTRRNFLNVAGRTAIAGCVASQLASEAIAGGTSENVSVKNIRCEHFAAHAEATLPAKVDGRSIQLKLVEATESKYPAMPGAIRQPFALQFDAAEQDLAQGMYQVKHPTLGWFEVHMSPVGIQGKRTSHLEAIFS